MKLAIGCDHAGFQLKSHLLKWLEQSEYQVQDLGTHEPASVDYPDFAAAVARCVASGEADRGILVCGSGVGVCIAANKVKGIRAAHCHDPILARLSREHNDSNIITMGERFITPMIAEEILSAWLNTPFEGGRHSRRVDKIMALETP